MATRWPPTTRKPVLGPGLVEKPTVKPTVPFPVPPDPEVTVSQESLLAAVQAQSGGVAVTAMLPVALAGAKVCVSGLAV